jgi:hypothetical protein
MADTVNGIWHKASRSFTCADARRGRKHLSRSAPGRLGCIEVRPIQELEIQE